MLPGILFPSGNAYSNGAMLYRQVQKAVHKQSEPWQISYFAHVNKNLHFVLATVYHVKLQPGHQQLQTILDAEYCVPVKK